VTESDLAGVEGTDQAVVNTLDQRASTTMSVSLKRFTSFDFAVGIGYTEAWVNPAQIAYVQPRRRRHPTDQDRDALDGTLLYFQQEAGVLAVKEDLGYVVAVLQSGKAGVCRECYQLLDEAWASVCTDCIRNRHNGVHHDPEEALA
jgi:hypothetical protein